MSVAAELAEKFQGTLLGGAIGDALGARFEGQINVPAESLLAHLENPGDLVFTDDTHMVLGLGESLLSRGGFDGRHLSLTFARHYDVQPWRGYGSGPPEIFHMVRSGISWEEAPKRLFAGQGSYGNGAAMRVAPAALFAWDDLVEVAALARQTASVTHTHQLGVEGAVLQACAIAFLVDRSPDIGIDPADTVETLYGLVGSQQYFQRLDGILALWPRPWDDVAHTFETGLSALDSVPTALSAFLWHQGDFPRTVYAAIALGGDTDTIAAMAGALAGAYLGASRIPLHWRQSVEGSIDLSAMANDMLGISVLRPR